MSAGCVSWWLGLGVPNIRPGRQSELVAANLEAAVPVFLIEADGSDER